MSLRCAVTVSCFLVSECLGGDDADDALPVVKARGRHVEDDITRPPSEIVPQPRPVDVFGAEPSHDTLKVFGVGLSRTGTTSLSGHSLFCVAFVFAVLLCCVCVRLSRLFCFCFVQMRW